MRKKVLLGTPAPRPIVCAVVSAKEAIEIMHCSEAHWYGYVMKKRLVKAIPHGPKLTRYLRSEVEQLALNGYY